MIDRILLRKADMFVESSMELISEPLVIIFRKKNDLPHREQFSNQLRINLYSLFLRYHKYNAADIAMSSFLSNDEKLKGKFLVNYELIYERIPEEDLVEFVLHGFTARLCVYTSELSNKTYFTSYNFICFANTIKSYLNPNYA